MIGIYKVIYLPENKVVYVGQSIDIKKDLGNTNIIITILKNWDITVIFIEH